MPVESAAGIWDLDRTWPLGTDPFRQGDDHARLIKGAILDTFLNITEPVTASADDLNRPGIPAGAVMYVAGSLIPKGFILSQGQEVSRTTYAELYAAIGDTYGDGDGSTTFNLPDMRDAVPVGQSLGSGNGHVLGDRDDLFPATPNDQVVSMTLTPVIKT